MIDLNVILHPTDFSDLSRCALPYAIDFARRFSAQLTLLHVIELPYGAISQAHEAIQDAETRLRDLVTPEEVDGIDVARIVKRGKPSQEICGVANEIDADIIIIATHGHSGLENALLGSTVERVVRKAPCPVLTIRHPEHEFVHP